MLPPQTRAIETGVVTLIAMQARPNGIEPLTVPETRRWLKAIQRRLSPRIPLGSRLVVVGPRYVEFTICSRVEPEPGLDPESVEKAVKDVLSKRLALVTQGAGKLPRAFGLAVTRRDLSAVRYKRLPAFAECWSCKLSWRAERPPMR